MSRVVFAIGFAAGITLLQGANANAATLVVGSDPTCQPGLPHYLTIQAAVDASVAGGTVLVCPGTYPEQVEVDVPITLKGVINGTQGAAVLTVPAGGFAPNVVSPTFGPESAQLFFSNFAGSQATISNLTLDGTGGTCPTAAPGGATRTVGLKLLNVGNKYSTGAKVTGLSVRYQFDGCGLGEGMDVENSWVTIDGNEIHDIDRHGILMTGGGGTISNNTISNAAYFPAADTFGISLVNTKNMLLTLNAVSAQRGVQFAGTTTGTTFVGNTIGPYTTQGVYLNGVTGNHVWLNRITASYVNVFVRASSNNDVVGNVIRLQSFGIVDENSLGGNSFTSNTLNEGQFCFWINGNPADTYTSNTFQNCTTTISKN